MQTNKKASILLKKPHKGLIVGLIILLFGTTGAFAYKYYQLKQTIKTQVTTSPDPTENWKIYVSKTNDIRIKYPYGWDLNHEDKVYLNAGEEELNLEIVFEDRSQKESCGPYACYPSVYLTIPLRDKNKIRLSPVEWTKTFFTSRKIVVTTEGLNNLNFEEINIDNSPAVKVQFSTTREYVFIFKDNNVYIIILELVNYKNRENYLTIFNQILSTFKFTN